MSQVGILSGGGGGGGSNVQTLTGNTGGPIAPVANNINTVGTGSVTISGSGDTLTTQLTGLTNHNVLIGAGTTTITKVAPSATAGVPLVSSGAAADPAFGTAVVAGGGTGAVSFTAYAVLTGGTTSTNPVQSIASVGTAAQVLTSNGAGALPTFQTIVSTILTFTTPGAYPYTVLQSDQIVKVDTSSARTINLPNAPTTGTLFIIKDTVGSAGTNAITLTTVGGVVTIDGATSQTMNVNRASLYVCFDGTAYHIL